MAAEPALQPANNGLDSLLRIKVVPGAASSEIGGLLGDALKVRVSAPPEGGQANEAVCALLAESLRLKSKAVTIISGHGHALKVVLIRGKSVAEVGSLLGI